MKNARYVNRGYVIKVGKKLRLHKGGAKLRACIFHSGRAAALKALPVHLFTEVWHEFHLTVAIWDAWMDKLKFYTVWH